MSLEKAFLDAQKQYNEAMAKHRASVVDAVQEIKHKIEQLKLELKRPTKKTITMAIPSENLSDLAKVVLNRCGSGYEGGNKFTVIWQSDSGNFIILRQPGRFYWSGIGSQSYGKTEFNLVDARCAVLDRFDVSTDGHLISYQGRFSKTVLDEWIRKATAYEKKHPKYVELRIIPWDKRMDVE